MQEQSSRREIGDLERQLRSSEALVAEFQKTLQQRDSELETLRSTVGPPSPESLLPNSQCMNAIIVGSALALLNPPYSNTDN